MLVSSGNSQRLRQISCPPRMAYRTLPSMAASSSSSSSKKHDVFISFRGEDTRNNFTSHLCAALNQSKIQVFIDNRISKGDENSSSIFKAIRDSNVSVVVLSKDYASSTWCMRELTKILEQKKHGKGHIVVPVFYKIDPSHVRKQIGTYKKAFEKHERDVKHNILLKWKSALTEVANLVGWDSQNYRIESELVEEVVKDVMQKLNCIYPPEVKDLVGIDQNLAPIKSLLRIRSREVRIIGIWGMGGIGKTTIAKALFSKLSSQYEGSCFLENVREESEQHLLNKLLSEVLEDANHYFGTPIARSTFFMRRLSRKKVLIVLDDVDNPKKLEVLAAKHNFLGPGSRVIVTTRDKHVLSKGVDEIYEVKGLPLHHAIRLFSLNAFDKSYPESGFVMQSKMVVDYANGNPLALKVLGSFLHSRNLQQWNSALRKLTKIPNTEIQNVLRWSYDGLDDDEQKNMFLDIACFFQGEKKETVTRLLDICGFYADIGIRILQDKALITFSDANELHMHDLIQEMGLEIVRQESTKDPGRRSRLWDPEEIYDVLKNDRGSDAVEGIMLDVSQMRVLNLSYESFSRMTSLRFIKFYMSRGRTCNLFLLSGLESLSSKLRYLQWDGYPSKSLPSTFSPDNLVVLSMMGSHVEKLWDGVKSLPGLKEINLRACSNLTNLPDLSLAPNLERVDLSLCTSLLCVPTSIKYTNKLLLFNLESCKNLKSLPRNIHLFSLQMFILKGCSSLDEFSLTSENMTRLDLRGTDIEHFPESLWQLLNQLVYLNLESCAKLKSLTSNIHLVSLQRLNLRDCSSLEVFSVTSENMEYLNLGGTSIKGLPTSIWRNNKLFTLVLHSCKRLVNFPDKPKLGELSLTFNEQNSFEGPTVDEPWNLSSLSDLSLKGSGIVNLPASIKDLPRLKKLTLMDCKKLRSLPSLPSSLEDLSLDERNIDFLPVNIKDLSHLKKLTIINKKRQFSPPELPPSLKDIFLNESKVDSLLLSMKDLSHPQKFPLIKCKWLHPLLEFPPFLEDLSINESNIECLPVSIKDLSHLRKLSLIECQRLRYLPELPRSLEHLSVNGCNIESLPRNIKDLSHLQTITLVDCKRLRSVPELPPCLQSFCAADCRSLEIVPSSRTILMEERIAFYYNCINLDQNSRNNIIADAPFEAAFASLKERTPLGPLISICLPGIEIPDWFSYQTPNSALNIEIPQQWFIDSKFLGFALCLVIGGSHQNSNEGYDPDINCYHFVKPAGNSDPNDRFLGHCTTIMQVPWGFNSDHIFICYYPAFNVPIMQDFKDLAKYYDANSLNLRVIFKFKGPSQRLDLVKKCGVRPLLIANTKRIHIET
ncbi:TMV resistance protein N-like [Arachis ipaensis]|nr:TMV resistance protein N-like [Arachis ipaensis]QHO07272.1 TMV resistance protein N [Arachis hypogaea]